MAWMIWAYLGNFSNHLFISMTDKILNVEGLDIQ